MNKLNGNMIDTVAVSLAALKASAEGDMLLFLDDSGALTLFEVKVRVGQRGRKGGTALTLVDVVSDHALDLTTTNTLPEGILRVWKVLPGVNARTLRKLESSVGEEPAKAEASESVVESAPAESPVVESAPESAEVLAAMVMVEPVSAEEPASEPVVSLDSVSDVVVGDETLDLISEIVSMDAPAAE